MTESNCTGNQTVELAEDFGYCSFVVEELLGSSQGGSGKAVSHKTNLFLLQISDQKLFLISKGRFYSGHFITERVKNGILIISKFRDKPIRYLAPLVHQPNSGYSQSLVVHHLQQWEGHRNFLSRPHLDLSLSSTECQPPLRSQDD